MWVIGLLFIIFVQLQKSPPWFLTWTGRDRGAVGMERGSEGLGQGKWGYGERVGVGPKGGE